jgi:hypothetical protein
MQMLVVEDSPVYRQLSTSHLQEWVFVELCRRIRPAASGNSYSYIIS